MKPVDAVMQELWKVKDANAKQHRTVEAYLAFLRKQGGQTSSSHGETRRPRPRGTRTKAVVAP